MSINTETIQKLYSNTLVVFPKKLNPKENTFIYKYNELINNNLEFIDNEELINVYIILNTNSINNKIEINLLKSIIDACKILNTTIAIINQDKYKLNQKTIEEKADKIYLAFGYKYNDFEINIPIQNYIEYQDKKRNIILLSDNLLQLNSNKELKKMLWITLKKILNL